MLHDWRSNGLHIGDVYEIETSIGLAYMQYSHFHPERRWLLRVVSEIFAERPSDVGKLVASAPAWFQFVDLEDAFAEGVIRTVGTSAIPECAPPFPEFRWQDWDVDQKRRRCGIWDGAQDRVLDALTPDQARLPILATLQIESLVKLIEHGFNPASGEWYSHYFAGPSANALDGRSACAWIKLLLKTCDLSMVLEILEYVAGRGSDFLDGTSAAEARAACEVLARICGDRVQSNSTAMKIDDWVKRTKLTASADVVRLATAALDRIVEHPSEDLESWERLGRAGEWRTDVMKLRRRLLAARG